MFLSHKIMLDANAGQRAYFSRAAGTARFVWNWALAEWNRQYAAGGKPTGFGLKKQFNAIKYQQFPWLRDVHRDAHARPFSSLQKAWGRFFAGRAGGPRFKAKKRCRESFYVANDELCVEDKLVRLPLIGWVKMRQPLRFTGKIMGAVVSCTAGRWYIAIQVDVGDTYRRERTGDGVVGMDLGLTAFATLSTGEKVEAPKPLRRHLRRLRLRQRSLSRRAKGSKNREKQRLVVARVHARVANIRSDFLHKFTTRLCRENQAVGVETLNVSGMLRNRKLARAISDVAWGEAFRQLAYKAPLHDCTLTKADRFYPSSKTCSGCGKVKESLELSERVFTCDGCGLMRDRDHNAALNLVPGDAGKLTAVDSM